MSIYIIAYDIKNNSGSFDYDKLISNLEENGCHRIQYSTWLGNFSNSAKQVHDHFKEFLDSDDGLAVMEITNNRHYSGAKPGTNDWFKNNYVTG